MKIDNLTKEELQNKIISLSNKSHNYKLAFWLAFTMCIFVLCLYGMIAYYYEGMKKEIKDYNVLLDEKRDLEWKIYCLEGDVHDLKRENNFLKSEVKLWKTASKIKLY